jgi:hypothetical protein
VARQRPELVPDPLALLYGRDHKLVENFCRDAPDHAARAPHAVHPATPGTSRLLAYRLKNKTAKLTMQRAAARGGLIGPLP